MKLHKVNLYGLFGVIGFIVATTSQADVWVGSDNNCNFTTIQAAIDFVETGAENTIRIANNVANETYFENLNFDNSGVDGTVLIQGGYEQCQGNSISSPVIIDGSAAAPVFNIMGDGTSKAITLNKLVLKNGLYDISAEKAGGLNIFGNELDVFFNEVTLSQNTGIRGGGLYSSGSNQRLYLYSVNIANNSAQNGGGLACDFSTIFVRHPSAISFNSAASGLANEGNGGGIYANFSCVVSVQSGDNSVAGISGVVGNIASNHGGGIYSSTQARVVVSERDGSIPTIKDNVADSDNDGIGNGGGIFATGSNTQAEIRHGYLVGNQASNGGGVAASDSAQLDLFQNSVSCQKDQTCTYVKNNQAGRNLNNNAYGYGGAFYADQGASVNVTRSTITGNLADYASVAAANSGGSVTLRASFINNNGDFGNSDFNDNYLMLAVNDDSQITVGNVTIADNKINASSNAVFLAAFGATIRSDYSIIQDDNVNVLEAFNNGGQQNYIRFDCNVLHEAQSINGGNYIFNNLETTTAVDFVAPLSGDYHILPTSAAVDLCNNSISWPVDADGDSWGYDDPYAVGFFDPNYSIDAGADETYSTDIIFKNKFD